MLKSIARTLLLIVTPWLTASDDSSKNGLPEEVSYYEHVRPIFQAKCHGCHQPAKSKGDYVMTEVARLIEGGEGDMPVVVAHKPEESYLLDMVTLQPGDDRPEMPEEDEPLTPYELALVSAWIEQGAIDDTPENARQRYNEENLPQYAVAPVITSLDFSPDGTLLAVAGFHEVLLHNSDGSGIVARLVGLSERIESARFSPDGKQLAVAGGLPGRMGEIQIWDVEDRELVLSKPVGYDTAYGASWSPDGKQIAFGLPDNTVRAIDAVSGEEVLFMGGHNDWVLDTVWSVHGDHLVSVARDMSAKLTHVETERFIDNITSITPGALRGGLNAIDRHPDEDHVLVGGSDGVPQIYRMYRETERKIGDNANLIRKYPPMNGRIWSVSFSPDGKTFAAVSSYNGKGQINLYQSDYDATITPELKKLLETARRNPDGSKNIDPQIEEFQTRGAKLLHSVDLDSPVFSVTYSPDGRMVAAGTSDGRIQLIDSSLGELAKEFIPVEIADSKSLAEVGPKRPEKPVNLKKGKGAAVVDRIPEGTRVTSLSMEPGSIVLKSPEDYNQILVTGILNTGTKVDLTRMVDWSFNRPIAMVEKRGIIWPRAEGRATLTVSFGGKKATAKVEISGLEKTFHPDFTRDVNPILTRLGCNAGQCHGAKDGKAGFKLSLRGYDILHDVRAFSDDHAARRVNFASPDDSLMLLKATGAVPHEGSAVTDIGSNFYEIVRQWISDGAEVNLDSRKVSRIELSPQNPVIQEIGSNQQIRVVAHYPDGSKRDVTGEAIVESGNTEVAEADDFGLISTIRRGEAPILVRYEGAYAATTVTVMGNRDGFDWEEPEVWGEIDSLVAAKWERMKILPSRLTSDNEFIRRIHLDLTGLPPESEAVKSFVADSRPLRVKRSEVIDSLIGSADFVDHWSNKWADMLQVNSKFLGEEGAKLFRKWIHEQVETNTPYDKFVFDILTAKGSNKENPAASYYKILRTPEDLVENTTHLFLGTRFNCNKCHDHPFEKWNVDNYYQTAAYFAQIDLSRDKDNSKDKNIGGTAVESARPLFEVVDDKGEGEVTNIVTGKVAQPTFPYEASLKTAYLENPDEPTRREELAAWLISDDNQFFAKSYANRIWGYLTGTGIIEPIDDIRAGNPPTNPELLDYLTDRFIESNFNVQDLMREICNSRTYQLSIESVPYNEDDKINYSRGKARRLPAEVLFDAVYSVTGAIPNIPGAEKGMRAAQLFDAKLDTESGFLANLGRPTRESACECDRQNDVQLGAVMSLLSGPSVAEAVGDPNNALAKMVAAEVDERALIEGIYLRVLSREPTREETDIVLENWKLIGDDHHRLLKRLAKMESDWVFEKAKRETARIAAIAKAQSEIDVYLPGYNQKRNAMKAARGDRIAETETALCDFEEKQLKGLVAATLDGLSQDRFGTVWEPRIPEKAVSAFKKVKLAISEDGAVSASGEKVFNAVYTLTIPVPEGKVSGLMLEALTDDSFEGFGPGLNDSGKFVLTEIELNTQSDGESEQSESLRFSDARADFTEEGYDVRNAINGSKERNDKGWSIGEEGRRPHWARFALEAPLMIGEEGGELEVVITCRYSDNEFPLGKFRLYTTNSEDPLNRGLPLDVSKALSSETNNSKRITNTQIQNWIKFQNPDYLDKHFAWVTALRPLPADPKMESLQSALAKAERPVLEDAALVQLRSDVGYSVEQAANRRLTAAQDLTWALINNAAFIFNH